MRGKNGICTVSERKIKAVKKLLLKFSPLPPKHSERPASAISLRDISRMTGVSFYTVWMIKEGKYDTNEPLKVDNKPTAGLFNVNELPCWITGYEVNMEASGRGRKLIA